MSAALNLQTKKHVASYESDAAEGYDFYVEQSTNAVSNSGEGDSVSQPELDDRFENNVLFLAEERGIRNSLSQYLAINFYAIRDFLRDRPNISRFIAKAAPAIYEHFNNIDCVHAELVEGFEDGDPDKLFITVIFDNTYSEDEAIQAYNDFYDNWWFVASEEFGQHTIFGIS